LDAQLESSENTPTLNWLNDQKILLTNGKLFFQTNPHHQADQPKHRLKSRSTPKKMAIFSTLIQLLSIRRKEIHWKWWRRRPTQKKPRNDTNSTNYEDDRPKVSEETKKTKSNKNLTRSDTHITTTNRFTQEEQLRTSSESIGTGGDSRGRAREKFISALSLSPTGDLDPGSVGTEIETELYNMSDNGKSSSYLPKLRTLLFNLKDPKNAELRESILSGHISPRQLCQMSSQDMASSDLKEWRKKTEESFTKAAQVNGGGEEEATCDSFKCSKCGSRKTKYNDMSFSRPALPMNP